MQTKASDVFLYQSLTFLFGWMSDKKTGASFLLARSSLFSETSAEDELYNIWAGSSHSASTAKPPTKLKPLLQSDVLSLYSPFGLTAVLYLQLVYYLNCRVRKKIMNMTQDEIRLI